ATDPPPAGPPGGPPKLDPQMSELFLAVGRNDTAAIQALLKTGVKPDVRNYLGITPLIYAAGADRKEAAEALLEGGAQVDAESPFGTALTLAESEGHARMAKLPLDRNAALQPQRVHRIPPLTPPSPSRHPYGLR